MAIIARRFLPLLAFAVLLVAGGEAGAHSQEHDTRRRRPATVLNFIVRRKASAAFAPDGTLWLTWAAGGRVSIAKSSDLGEIVRRRR